jgi:bile acid-coenzyme A ligase
MGEIYMMPATGSGSTYRYVGAEAERDDQGWETVGDMGWLDGDGYLFLADRRSDMILTGGRNVYPAEVEAALEEHPAVRSSCVIGLPDEDLGNVIHAILETAEVVSDDALREHLADRLARHKLPRSFERVDEPLRDDAGKLRRSALRAERISG